jgi:hypothetical protein
MLEEGFSIHHIIKERVYRRGAKYIKFAARVVGGGAHRGGKPTKRRKNSLVC